jgi:hypothetical protein
MIEEPVPTMPEIVPATSPTARTKRKLNGLCSCQRRRFSTARFALRHERVDIDGCNASG